MTTIAMTCRNCSKPFKRRTRVGSRTSCPHCGEWQNGPAAVQKQSEHLAEHEKKQSEKNKKDTERRAQQPAKKTAPAKAVRKADSSAEPDPVATSAGSTEVGKIPPPERKEPEERHAGWLF